MPLHHNSSEDSLDATKSDPGAGEGGTPEPIPREEASLSRDPVSPSEDDLPSDEGLPGEELFNEGPSEEELKSQPKTQPSGRGKRLLLTAAKVALALWIGSLVLVIPWRWIPLPTTAFMVREAVFGQQESISYRWVPLEKISPHFAIAAVASEDQLFPQHHGFDLEAIADALDDRGRKRGASTISQQVAKNLFLWPGRSYLRKGLEAYLTVLLEATWSKQRILEVYLNVAELGPGVFGAEAASQSFFGKPAAALTLREASLLAAVLPNPKGRSASRPSAAVERRGAEIRQQARNLGGAAYLGDL